MTAIQNVSVYFGMKRYFVYALYDPFTAECFYVGLTTNILNRLCDHVSRNDNPRSLKEIKIQEIRNAGRKPLVEILWSYKCGQDRASDKEREWIAKKLSEGATLTNIMEGGIMPPSQKGKKASPELIQRLIEASTRKKTIAQYDKSGELVASFVGARAAGRETGIDHRSIAAVAGGSPIRKTAGGYVWKYLKPC